MADVHVDRLAVGLHPERRLEATLLGVDERGGAEEEQGDQGDAHGHLRRPR